VAHHKKRLGMHGRGFSAPGSFTPLSQGGAAGWAMSHPTHAALPSPMVHLVLDLCKLREIKQCKILGGLLLSKLVREYKSSTVVKY